MSDAESMLDFTNEEGMRTRIFKDEHGHIVVRFTVDSREAVARFTSSEAQEIINGIVAAKQPPVVGGWGFHHGRPIHIPSYQAGVKDAEGPVMM